MIRLAIVADSHIVRAGLPALFGGEPDVVVSFPHDAARGDDDASDAIGVDVLLRVASHDAESAIAHGDDDLDARDGRNGRDARVPTITLLERMDQESARQALAAGASGVLA